jgi:1-acyl-sn-glycerol-3-phosphate acyltransferase
MKRGLQTLRGLACLVCLAGLTLLGSLPLLLASLVKRVLPWPRARAAATQAVLVIARYWARAANNAVLKISGTRVRYDQQVADHPSGRYILICNHQCWADALLLVHVLESRLPFPRFLIKEQLRWLPVVGLAFWALDFPFLKRHSRAAIETNPQLRADDMQAVHRACSALRDKSFTLVNYAEGTSSTRPKRIAAASPFHTLLPPKAGGIALALNALHDRLGGILDMSIGYADTPEPTFWDLLCGRIDEVAIRVRQLALPEALWDGDYNADAAYRDHFKAWLNDLWQTKDCEISAIQNPRDNVRSFP